MRDPLPVRSMLAVLLLAALGCSSTFRDEAHSRISQRMECPAAELRLQELPERRYLAEGCGKRGQYRCFHKRHIKASGARYVVCEREAVAGAAP